MIYFGWALLITGLSIRIFTIVQLRSNAHWRIQKPNQLIKTGIYQYIRHPMYLGGFFDYTGLCLLLTHNIGITIMFFIFMMNFIFDRIDREENFLCAAFGQEYVDYFKRTKMLIPFLF